MLSKERVLEVLKEAGVLQEGHFLLTSGRHSNKYLQCAKIFCNTKYSEELCADLANKFKNDDVEVVSAPPWEQSKWRMKSAALSNVKTFLPNVTKTAR